MRDQIAGVETAGKVSMESQSVKKCLKVVAFVCRVIPSVQFSATVSSFMVISFSFVDSIMPQIIL